MPASNLLWWEHCYPVQEPQNSVWSRYRYLPLGALKPGQAELTAANPEVSWIGLQHPRQLKEASPQAGDLQATQPHLEMGTLC